MGRRQGSSTGTVVATVAIVSVALLYATVGALIEESGTRSYEDDLNEVLKVALEKLLPLVSDLVTRPEVSVDCSTSMIKTFMALRQQKAWALRMTNEYGGNATVTSCSTDDAKEIAPVQALSIAVLCLLGLLVCVGTAIEWQSPTEVQGVGRKPGTVVHVLRVFSAIANTKFLLRTEFKPQNEALRFICGLKVLMTFWVVLGHGYIIIPLGYFHAVFAMAPMTERFTFQFITNAFLSVTMFFFLSGFLLAYLGLESQDALEKRSVFIVYIARASRRYVRLMAPAMVLILVALLLPLLAYGPAADDAYKQYIQGCYHKWWSVLLQTNNFDVSEHVCLPHLWYINADLQIFLIITFPLALLLTRQPKIAAVLGAFTAVLFCVITCVQIYSWDLFYGFTSGTNDMRKVKDTLELIYFRPFTHVGAYITGVLCGYVTVQCKNVATSPTVEMALWLISSALAGGVLFMSFPWNQGYLPDTVTNSLYGGFHQLLWALAFFWPSYACATGRGGVLNKALSWSFFVPLSRLTFGIYLIHVLLYMTRMLRLRTYINTDEYFQLTTALGVFSLSIVFAYLMYVCVEAPVLRLEKMVCEGSIRPYIVEPPVSKKVRSVHPSGTQKSTV
ncbi:nose resistant to fluoxetine protein 6-like isoform X2 [Haemaphysalis longicornis]